MNKKKQFYFWFFIAVILFVIDRLAKWWALHYLAKPLRFTDWFACELMLNRGISLGLFHFDHPFGYLVVSTLVSIILLLIVRWTWYVYRSGGPIVGQLLIIVGGLSNVIDRFFYGGVIDFILFSWGNLYWPLFNIADILIDIGVLILIIQMLKNK
ncbi:TPA: signal peptidase II [Candidatus Dependentiae bacterium]|nr:MAG: Lipoprotein signal peptidase [candidate division TM6 bacterium GW2011_GWF2_36_131]KKQ03500.1 MAG: Lipoprotein signal peptidase [candidate division TM6 bacterium GW2011_GWE2_36_25]HBR70765.1 signal peptidase II [Candidatus Dependentiae bacterium]HCU00150.1 signal peptidase II [Candidatus Dependentiae bacterium]